jgi:subtilase family serine protease
VQAYQTLFGLPANLPAVVVDGNDPGQNGDAAETYLDLEQAGTVAPAAQVVMYTSAGSVLTDPLFTSGLRALEDNVVSVISMSYANCEASLGQSGNAAWNELWQEAAAQGITGFVAAGDGGAAGCDDSDTESFAESGLAVNGLGSTPYNVSVGGTDFYYSDYAASPGTLDSQIGLYWSSTASNAPAVSLLQPAPE